MKVLNVASLAIFSCTASACLWDKDTLSVEASKYPDLMAATIGWFPRYPPLYYQMRRDRCLNDLKLDPSRLGEYDDAAVADDHLGDDTAAIKLMDLKKAVLDKMPESPEKSNQTYRYDANIGTFYVHRWARHGEKNSEIKDLHIAEDFIAKALAINPNSHFGRERVQLDVMRWMDDSTMRDGQNIEDLLSYLESGNPIENTRESRQKLLNGLGGLVMLGNAWESSEIFLEIRLIAERNVQQHLQAFARARYAELIVQETGKPWPQDSVPADPDKQSWDQKEYLRMRGLADAEHKRLTNFMMSRLKAGRHPDTDSTFWDGYAPAPAPVYRDDPVHPPVQSRWNSTTLGVVLALALAVPLMAFWLIRWRKSKL